MDLLIVIQLVRLVFEIVLTLSAIGLFIVAGSFLLLVAINVVEIVTGSRWRKPLPPAKLPDAELPDVLVQIPVFNEPEMVADALTTAAALDWPKDKLHIQLLDDSTDDTPAIADAVVQRLRAEGFDIAHIRREDRSGFKAGALGVGLTLSDAPFIAMLDVDFRPPSNWLRATVPYLVGDPKAAFLQCRCEFSNYKTNWLTRAQGMLLDSHFVVEQATRYRAHWLFQFNGTGGLWRRAAIASAGGWSAESLCEDLDLTIRAGLAGWHGIFLMEPVVPGLVPERVRHWRVQQRRWSNGFVQVARKLMGPIWGASQWPWTRKLSATALIMIQAFYPCAAIGLISLIFCLILSGLNPLAYLPLFGIAFVVLVLVAVGMTLVPYMILRRGTFPQYVKTVASLPPLMTFVSVSNAPSILKTLFGRREHFKRTPKTKAPTRA
jgi:cellulose synthase/poly-beta-1,6-N-acetylglucosamine synthase-like glycosyltransferase